MDSILMIRISPIVIFGLGVLVAIYRADQSQKARDRTFRDRGSSWSLGLGTCLSGLPGLDQPAPVSCGGTATELLFLSDADKREIGRIPWSAVQQIFGGTENETHLHLHAVDGLPSLTLAQSDHLRKDGKRYVPSYTVIDWTDGFSRRHQAVFEQRTPRTGGFLARELQFRKSTAGVTVQ